MIRENVAFAKSILTKKGITQESPEWADYLKIREICGEDHGYVGILTRIRFVDGIEDWDEIKSIYDILKTSKIDVPKLNRMSYDDILKLFYDELSGSKNRKDYELVYKDSKYSYYKVNTYEGNLKIGSPAWCLKTKSHWDAYQAKYGQCWVAIDNDYRGKLLTPETNYLSEYKNTTKPWVRYGISLRKSDDDGMISWTAFNDNNNNCRYDPESWTFFGVMSTLFNLINGRMKSYYQDFAGCESLSDSVAYNQVKDDKWIRDRFGLSDSWSEKIFRDSQVFIKFSKNYSSPPALLVLNTNYPFAFYPVTKKKFEIEVSDLVSEVVVKIVEEYAKSSKSLIYSGIKYKLGMKSIEDFRLIGSFLMFVDEKWVVFDKGDYFLVANLNPKIYQLPTLSYDDSNYDMTDPLFFWIRKSDYSVIRRDLKPIVKKDFHNLVIEKIKENLIEKEKRNDPILPEPKEAVPKETNVPEEEPKKEPKKVGGFWSFLRGRNEEMDYDLMSIYRDYDPNRKPKEKTKIKSFLDFERLPEPKKPEPVEPVSGVPKPVENPIRVISAIKNGGNREIIFTVANHLYKWSDQGGLIDGETNRESDNREIMGYVDDIKDGTDYIEISKPIK